MTPNGLPGCPSSPRNEDAKGAIFRGERQQQCSAVQCELAAESDAAVVP